MVTVLNNKPHKSVVKEIVCKHCGSLLEYTPQDVQARRYRDYDGSSDVDLYIRCPTCSKEVMVKPFN